MSQPVKLSDTLVLDARITGELMDRSIAGQVEFWAQLGRSIEPLLQGDRTLMLRRNAATRPLSECLATVDTAAGRERLRQHLDSQPFPHYEPHPTRAGIVLRIDADGTRTPGRFLQRKFQPEKTRRSRAPRA